MTLPELKQHFETAKAMILAEKTMRRRVFRGKPRPEGSRAAKLAAPRGFPDQAMAAVVAMKDELKKHVAGGVQAPLIATTEQPKRRY